MAGRPGKKRNLRGSKVVFEEPQAPARWGREPEPGPELPDKEQGPESAKQEGRRREKKRSKRKSKKRGKAPRPRGRSRSGAACPVCGGPGRRRRSSATVRCGGCGAVFRAFPAGGEAREAVALAAEAREAFYARAFGRPNHEERREAKGLAKEAMCGFFKTACGKPAALNGFGRNVLEVDCGLGMRLRAFQDYGWWVTGTETSATACEYARRQSLDVKLGSLSGILADGGFGKTRFDLALFCGSFGRVADPCISLMKLREAMEPRGLVCVLREPLACRGAKLACESSQILLHTAESLRRAFCERGFSFVSEEFGEETGTFWFRSKARK
jgi:SAM-dependent methyltransferase